MHESFFRCTSEDYLTAASAAIEKLMVEMTASKNWRWDVNIKSTPRGGRTADG